MPFFPCAHAANPLWQHAVQQVVAQLRVQIQLQQLAQPTRLGVVYVSAIYAAHARDIVATLAQELPDVQHWVGSAAHAVLAGDMDYGHSGAVAVMLLAVGVQDYQVFSGVMPWRTGAWAPQFALVQGDASSPTLVQEIQALRQQMPGAHVVGGLCDLHHQHAQWSWGANVAGGMPLSIGGGGVQVGGFSGVAFSADVACLAVGMQGCKPTGKAHTITQVDGDVVLALDGRPALEVFFYDVNWGDVLAQRAPDADAIWQKLQSAMMAMSAPGRYASGACLAADARVMRVMGIDPLRQGVLLQGMPTLGHTLTMCQPDEQALRADMRRACAELWESLTISPAYAAAEPDAAPPLGRSICGAIYMRNQQRHAVERFPRVDAELQWIRHALGPVPLLGFASAYEIDAGELQYLSAQLLVFTQPLQALS